MNKKEFMEKLNGLNVSDWRKKLGLTDKSLGYPYGEKSDLYIIGTTGMSSTICEQEVLVMTGDEFFDADLKEDEFHSGFRESALSDVEYFINT